MDMYGFSNPPTAQDLFRIDELLDLSNEELFTPSNNSSTTTNAAASTVLASTDTNQQHPPPQNPSTHSHNSHHSFTNSYSSDFTDLCVPSDDVAELEWLSRFVDDSFSDFPKNSLTGTLTVRSDMSFPGKARSKRSKAVNSTPNATSWTSSTETPVTGNSKVKRENHRQSSPTPEGGVRRCTHCASEKTPQWRTGPLGPKTLCNACGVRYKSGRLVPEYRPAASPTFVLTQHSNSHRKVLELRRQKEMMRQQQLQQQQQQKQIYRHQRDFEVC